MLSSRRFMCRNLQIMESLMELHASRKMKSLRIEYNLICYSNDFKLFYKGKDIANIRLLLNL